MEENIKETFAQQTLALLEKGKLEFKEYIQTNRIKKNFRTEIGIENTGITVKIKKTKISKTHHEIEPDPRMFGDTQAVTAAAMQDWYPGKTNSWTTVTTTVIIEINGLPDIGTHKETYQYTDQSWRDDTIKTIEKIIELVEHQYRENERKKDLVSETEKINQIKNAFAKIKDIKK